METQQLCNASGRRFCVGVGCVLVALVMQACEVAPLQTTGFAEQHITAPDQPPHIPAPDPQAAWVPDGYRVEIAVRNLIYPTSVEFDDDDAMYVAEGGYVYGDPAAPARILRINQNGDVQVFAEGFNAPITDLLWHDGRMYVSHRGVISTVDDTGRRRDVVTGLPSLGDHFNNQLCAGPDGKIYVGQGTVTNAGVVGTDNFAFGWLAKHPDLHDVPAQDIQVRDEEFVTLNPFVLGTPDPPLVRTAPFAAFGAEVDRGSMVRGSVKSNGTILRFDPNGENLEVYAWGLRNPFGVMWGPDNRLYAADNAYDNRGSRPIANAPDVIWQVREGAWYGFPDFAAGVPVTDERYAPEGKPNAEFLMENHPPVERPFALQPVHCGVTKMDFSSSDAFGFEGDMFLGHVGDMTPITGDSVPPTGFQVVRIDMQTR